VTAQDAESLLAPGHDANQTATNRG
jgi:hypothetical protein